MIILIVREKKRVEDVKKEKIDLETWMNNYEELGKGIINTRSLDNKYSDMPSHPMERGNIIDYGSPLAPKQKDKITTEDLKQKEVNCQYTMCGDKSCDCCYPDKPSELFKKAEVKDCVIKDSKVIIDEIIFGGDKYENVGIKESQTVKKAPIFTYCKQMKNALEQLAFRSEYGHNKYLEYDADYNNFARVPNGDEEYGNAMFRHALNIGEDSELDHYVAQAWDAVARLEIYLRNEKLKNS